MSADSAHLLAAARCLDLRDPSGAAAALCALDRPVGQAAASALWLATLRQIEPAQVERPAVTDTLDAIEARLDPRGRADGPWRVFWSWQRAVRLGAPTALALPVAQAVQTDIAALPPHARDTLYAAVLAEGQADLVLRLWRRVLRDGGAQPLDGWQAQALLAAARALAPEGPLALLDDTLRAAGRAELGPLLAALAVAVGQGTPAAIAASLAQVADPVDRGLVIDFLVRAPTTAARFLDLMAVIEPTLADTPAGPQTTGLLGLRRALATGDFAQALALSSDLVATAATHVDAVGLRAAAQLGLGRHAAAAAGASFLRTAPDLAWHDRGRGAALAWMVRMQRDGVIRDAAATLPAAGPGRPLVQMLWVGPRLRWIERIALRSWLLNGWRVQLFVYDPPDGVPDGVETMDASAILPRAAVFAEGAGSGGHSGSLGAFSDRFRYALLALRGGLWSDTDIINLRRFEPEGLRLVATEAANVGVDTLNGAWLAAPPGDRLVAMLHARAGGLVRDEALAFARLGPQLLCEVMAEHGTCGHSVLETAAINPLSWSETRRWFDPADEVAADPRLAGAAGLHVFTETWRQIGIDMEAAPPEGCFLGRAAARIAAAPLPAPGGPADAVRRLLGLEAGAC